MGMASPAAEKAAVAKVRPTLVEKRNLAKEAGEVEEAGQDEEAEELAEAAAEGRPLRNSR